MIDLIGINTDKKISIRNIILVLIISQIVPVITAGMIIARANGEYYPNTPTVFFTIWLVVNLIQIAVSIVVGIMIYLIQYFVPFYSTIPGAREII